MQQKLKKKKNNMHKLEKLILESYVSVLQEQERSTIKLKDVSPKVRQALEDRYGKSIDPDRDFLDSEMETYYFTNKIDKETGSVGHKVINLPSFKELYFGYSDIIDDIKVLMGNKEVQTDPKARELFELIKTNFRKIQSYLRNNRPDQYAMMKATRALEEAVEELKTNYNDPVLVKARAAKMRADKLKKADSIDNITRAHPKSNKKSLEDLKKLGFLRKERDQLMRDMEQEAEPEGGPIADMYGKKLNRIDNAIAKLSGRETMTYDQAISENTYINEGDLKKVLSDNRDQIELDFGPRTFKMLRVELLIGNESYVENWLVKNGYMKKEEMPFENITEEAGPETDGNSGRLNNIKTFGNLQRFIKDAKSRILGKKIGGALDAAIGFIPGLGNVKTGIDVIRALAKKQDGKTTNTFLDKMDIDDKASAIVDDKVEANFINYMHDRIQDQDPNKTLPSNFNMNQYFNDFLAAEYDKRTIDGINKVTERLKESGQKISKSNMDGYKKGNLKESLLDLINEQEPEEKPDLTAPKETVLEDATDQMLEKFPTLKAALIKLQTEDFKEFVDKIDWISPRPTEFRINLTNGQDYILKWTGKGFEAQIMGKRDFIDKINDYQQALDKLAILYKEGPMGEPEEPVEPADTNAGGGSGGDFPGDDAAGGEDDAADDAGLEGGEEGGGEDLTDEPVDFEEPAEEPEA